MNARDGSAETGFVLIHGSELGAWLWERTVPLLGRPTVAVDLPGRGSRPADRRSVRLDDAIQAVIEDANSCDAERVVLVAHSLSGFLMPGVVEGLGPRAAAVVLVGADVPVEGKAWVDLQPAPQRIMLRLMYRLRPGGMLSPAGLNRKTLCNDLDEATTEAFLRRRVAEAPGLLLDTVSAAAFPAALPCHYVRLTEDRSSDQATQQTMISRLPNAQTHELPSGHLPMLGHPEKLAGLLTSIADSSEARSRADSDQD